MISAGANSAPHVPVLVSEVIAALALRGGETIIDGTFGAGGYTRAMLAAGAGRVIGFDRDPDAIEAARSLFHDPRLTLVEERFSQMDRVLAERMASGWSTPSRSISALARCSSIVPSAAFRSRGTGPSTCA